MWAYMVSGRALVKTCSTNSWLISYPACRTSCSNSVISASRSPHSSLSPPASFACAFSCSMTLANCLLNESCTSSQSRSSVVSHRCLMTCPRNQALTPLTHSLTRGPWMYVRNNIARWYAFLIRSLVMFTPSYSCHCVMNSSALSRSPLKISGGLPTSLSPRPPGTTGAGGRGTGAGGPPPGGPPPPGNPPPGGPPPGNPPGGPPRGGSYPSEWDSWRFASSSLCAWRICLVWSYCPV
jgi:hypothetical protein